MQMDWKYYIKRTLINVLLFAFLSGVLSAKVKPGVDVLVESDYSLIAGKRVALLTNITGSTSNGQLTAELFSKATNFTLVTVFTPEHGFYAAVPAGEKVADSTVFGVRTCSLYGSNRRPSREQLSGCDVVVVDIQDIGIRSYTYFSTVFKIMDACAEYGKQMIILDRPNPINGIAVDGNVLEMKWQSFIGIIPVPYLHGCTIGELASMANGEGWLPAGADGKPRRCSLSVIKMQGWDRTMRWEDTGLPWIPTSPNIPTPDAIRGAAALGVFGELSIAGIGIGSSKPFQYIGKPDFNTQKLMKVIDGSEYPGMIIKDTVYSPQRGMYTGKTVKALELGFVPDSAFCPYTSGIRLMLAIRKIYPDIFPRVIKDENRKTMFCKATGTEEILNAFLKRATDGYIMKAASKGIDRYRAIRSRYLLY